MVYLMPIAYNRIFFFLFLFFYIYWSHFCVPAIYRGLSQLFVRLRLTLIWCCGWPFEHVMVMTFARRMAFIFSLRGFFARCFLSILWWRFFLIPLAIPFVSFDNHPVYWYSKMDVLVLNEGFWKRTLLRDAILCLFFFFFFPFVCPCSYLFRSDWS